VVQSPVAGATARPQNCICRANLPAARFPSPLRKWRLAQPRAFGCSRPSPVVRPAPCEGEAARQAPTIILAAGVGFCVSRAVYWKARLSRAEKCSKTTRRP